MLNKGFLISSYTYKEPNVVTLYKTPVKPLITGTFKTHTFALVAPKQRSPEVKKQQFIHTFVWLVHFFLADKKKVPCLSTWLTSAHLVLKPSCYQEEVREASAKNLIKDDALNLS